MDLKHSRKMRSSRSWVVSYTLEVFSDSFYVGNTLNEVFGYAKNDVQWIAVLDNNPYLGPPGWDVWVCFSTPQTQLEIDKRMSSILCGSISGGSTDILPAKGDLIPTDMVCRCIQGSPYIQHNVHVDWKEIAKKIQATTD